MASAGMMGNGGRRIAELPLFARARPEAVACCRRIPWLALHCPPPAHLPASPRKGHYPFDVTTTALNHQAGGAHEKEGQWEGMSERTHVSDDNTHERGGRLAYVRACVHV